jgi:hypothetical protein
MIDLAKNIGQVARMLCGEPNEARSNKNELRFGTHGSLSVKTAGEGCGTWFDHERGFGGGVVDLIKDKLGCDNAGVAEWLEEKLGLPRRGNGKDAAIKVIVAKYTYHDEAGAVRYRVLRYFPKAFSQQRLDGESWVSNMDGAELVLYRLPSLMTAVDMGKLIFVVEGEKDVEALRGIDLDATSSPGGASKGRSKWLPSYNGHFTGADVIIIPDNDEAGACHARSIANNLARVAKRVRILELPNLPPSGDVSNWLQAGGTRKELLRLAAAAPDWQAPAEVTEQADEAEQVEEDAEQEQAEGEAEQESGGDEEEAQPRLSPRDIAADTSPIPPRQWLLGNYFCRGFVSALTAAGASGKTSLRLVQFLSLASGRDLLGQHVFRRCKVLVVSLEDDLDELRRRITAAMKHYNLTSADVAGHLYVDTTRGLRLMEMRGGTLEPGRLLPALYEAVTTLGIDLLAIDPFVKSHGAPENDNGAIDQVVTMLTTLASELGIAVDLLHHTRKGTVGAGDADGGRGASSFRDAARLSYSLTTMTPEEAERFDIREEDRRAYIRLDSSKVNLAPASVASWFELISVALNNGDSSYPAGDLIQVAMRWTPPSTWAGLSNVIINQALDVIDTGMENGQRWSSASAAGERHAWRAVQKHCPEKSEAQCREIVNAWVKAGVLYTDDYYDEVERKTRKGLRVNAAKRPSSCHQGHQE